MDQSFIALIALLFGPGGFILASISLYSQRRTRKAEAREKESNSARLEQEITDRVLARANTEIEKLQARVTALEAEVEEYKIGVGLLLGQLINAKLKPTWIPKGVNVNQDKSGLGR